MFDWIRRKFGPRVGPPVPAPACAPVPATGGTDPALAIDASISRIIAVLETLGETTLVVRWSDAASMYKLHATGAAPQSVAPLAGWALDYLRKLPQAEMH